MTCRSRVVVEHHRSVPGPYLALILISFAGVLLLAGRFLPGVVRLRLLRPVAVVLVVFLAFDAVGAARGWFASSPDWVVASVPPGIPAEEPVLLAFLALFSVVLFEGFRRAGVRPRVTAEVERPAADG
jgi:hypothetical protein